MHITFFNGRDASTIEAALQILNLFPVRLLDAENQANVRTVALDVIRSMSGIPFYLLGGFDKGVNLIDQMILREDRSFLINMF